MLSDPIKQESFMNWSMKSWSELTTDELYELLALRRGNEITSIEQAVIRLGFNRLRSVVVASGIISSFKAPPGFDKHHFWTQTFQVATIARTLAQHR
jgi:c-di-GMP-related signal transduction protein